MNPQKQELTTVEERRVVVDGAESVMALITRAASDNSIDIEKLERLTALYERLTAGGAERAFNEAMNLAQEELRPVAADANNPQTKSKYASYAALDRAIRPIYTRHGFSLSFNTADGAPVEHVRVVCRVAHRDGHKEPYHIDMPADGKGAKGGDVMTKTHATGAALSYGSRYLLKLIFNIAVGEDDTDGNSNGGRDASPALQAATAAVNACNTSADLASWKAANIKNIEQMASDDADAIVRLVNQRARNLKGAGK